MLLLLSHPYGHATAVRSQELELLQLTSVRQDSGTIDLQYFFGPDSCLIHV